MGQPAKRRATYQDVLAAPEHLVAELLDGQLYLQARPAKPHAEAASVLGMLIGPPFRLGKGGPGGWWIQDEPELHLGDDVLVPDLAGWRRETMPSLDLSAPYYNEVPDWVCEVLSPSTERIDRLKKVRKYAQAGVGHLWLAHPVNRTLEVYRRVEDKWLLLDVFAGAEEVRAEPFDAVGLDLTEVWAAAPELPEG